jgi:hypothetical protein
MQLLNTLLILGINYPIFLVLKNNQRYVYLRYALVASVVFALLNLMVGPFPTRLIPVQIMFSCSVLIVQRAANRRDVTRNHNSHIDAHTLQRFQRFKHIAILYIMPLFITVFQLLLLWSEVLQKGMLRVR